MTQLALFDYDQLDTETRIVVQQEDKEFDQNMGDAGSSFIRACHNLKRIHEALKYKRPGFVNYCDSKQGLSNGTAYRMIDVAKMFPNLGNIAAAPSALYLLAAPSTSDEARQEAIEHAGNGEQITYTKARQLVNNHRDPNYQDKDKEYIGSLWSAEGNSRNIPDLPKDSLALNGKPHVSHNSGNNEWYTPSEYIKAAHDVMGAIDLDPASCADANIVVKAARYYSQENDGLIQDWQGRVWMNPPYAADLIDRFAQKLVNHVLDGSITEAIVLVNNATETSWFRQLVNVASAVTFPASRVKFWKQDGSTGAPLQGQAVLYIGLNTNKFLEVFGKFGWGAIVQ